MSRPESQPATALVIDDDPGMLTLLQALLQDAGFATTCVTHIHSALEEIARHPFDVLVIDQWLPDGNGLQICEAARRYYGNQPAILIVTADARSQRAVLALQLGADDVISKPFDIHELVARIQVCLRRRPTS
jgi:DNA-binding response OmpR family regulator